jgi:protein-S-isoprenylcysteine O-methyltransferase Ste14
VIRDHVIRRKTMFVLLIVALVLLFSGSTFLQGVITPREHPFWFVLFWLICAWLTVTAMLLAIFDLLMVRLAGRRAERQLRERLEETSNSNQ